MRRLICLFALFLAFGGIVADDSDRPAPRLIAETVGDTQQLWVEIGATRHLLAQSSSALLPGDSGWDPAGQAAFANWTEAGRAFAAYTRDAGASWSASAPRQLDIRLLAGARSPGQAMPSPAGGLAAGDGAGLFLVQFETVSLPEWRAAIGDLGGLVLNYMPFNTHIVRINPVLTPALAGLDFVERVEPYHPSYRLEAELQSFIAGSAPDALENENGQILVRTVAFEWGPAGKARIAEAAQGFGAAVETNWPTGHVIELWADRDQLRRIAALDDVMWIDRWTPAETDMDLVRQDSGADWLETNTGRCGQGVRGEVMDNGIQADHQDFDGLLLHTGHDVQSHGTNTTGIVFGNGDRDGDGDGTATGHMPCAEQAIFADYGNSGDRFTHTQELKNAPYFASFQTNSWGSSRTTQYTSVSQEMDDIIWRLDIAILQSQSNAGNQNSRPQAWAKNIIAVGGIRHYNTLTTTDDAWAGGASIGPAADGRIKPDLNYWYDSIRTTTTGNGYTSGFGGTSAATPEAAGVVGLMVQMWAENVWNTNPTGSTVFEKQPHASTIKALAINNAMQYDFVGTGSDLTRVHQGWGRPNVQLAEERAATSFIVDEETPLQVGQSVSYDVIVASGESELKVTMIYPDLPGTTGSTLHRINDLSLKVTSPGGTVYHGNVGLDAGTSSVAGGAPNTIDTVENVFVANPAAGTWTVEVSAPEVNQDAHLDTPEVDAAFALVVTGATGDPGECGNGIREAAEDCDGADLGGATCAGEGCSGGGTLSCNANCTFNFDLCSGCPTCDDDGDCEAFEDCRSCPNDCRTGTLATCGNDVCEAANGEDCITCPQDCNGRQGGKPANRYCCGAGGGENPVDCTDPRCTASGLTCQGIPAAEACCGDGTCEGDETGNNCSIDCGSCANDEAGACTDGADNDCDGLIDCADSDCADDPACAGSCNPLGAACNVASDCCTNKCKGPSGRKTCK